MIPRGQQFLLETAAEGLIQMWKVWIPDAADRKEQATQILQWCVQDEEQMVAEAMRKGDGKTRGTDPGRLTGFGGRCIAATGHQATSTRPYGHE